MKIALLAAAAVAAVAATPSQALIYDITFTGGTTAHILFTASNATIGANGHLITSAAGTAAGEAVSLVPGGPGVFGIPGFNVDNVVYKGSDPIFDTYGLALQSATGYYNLWGNGSPNSYTLYKYDTAVGGYTIGDIGTLSVVAVPEAATWAMLIAGFGLVGFAARRQRTLAAA